ncbi:MAG: S-layer homology domain-containing protein [Bacillota bacterium]
MKIRNKSLIAMISAILMMSINSTASAGTFTDTGGNWAEKSIADLYQKNIVNGYPDGSFRPYRLLSRAEFAKLISLSYNIKGSKVFPDTSRHWAKEYIGGLVKENILHGYSDGQFKPEQLISRAEMIKIIMSVNGVISPEDKFIDEWEQTFRDLPGDHWAFRPVELAKRLEILPPQWTDTFQPDKPVTRSETAWLLEKSLNYRIIKGKISAVNLAGSTISVQTAKALDTIPLSYQTLVVRNHVSSIFDQLQMNDEVMVYSNSNGDAVYIKALGLVTKNDLLSRLSLMFKNKITPEQIAAAMQGDWSSVQTGLQGDLYNTLINMGLTPGEAESLLLADWGSLSGLSQERLSQALSQKYGLSLDLSRALLARDWNGIVDAGKVDLSSALIGRLLPQEKF